MFSTHPRCSSNRFNLYSNIDCDSVQFDTPCHSRVTGAQLDAASGICQADVTIPKGTPAGTYQLVWYWPFRYASATVIKITQRN